jgi:DNA invertase Pin-like site-specific DNA recombinase
MLTHQDRTPPKFAQPDGAVVRDTSLPNCRLVHAAQYVRVSTERQCYSTENQFEAIAQYARHHGIVIVQTFADEGKSGLSLERRPGLLSLLSMVQRGLADFEMILVYDVSRWGRFQDADESGYWEFVCKRSGVIIHYCAEPFINDGSLSSTILKNLKRTMAAEYSRELSIKVFSGQCRLVKLGFRQGGRVGFGLRRLLVDQERRSKGILMDGQTKSIQSDRVVLVPGPEEEQNIVREVFHSFADEGKSQLGIARSLNARGIPNGKSCPWNYAHVHDILVNPKYIGTNVFNRKSLKLHRPAVQNPKELWIRKECAFPPIVSEDLFLRTAKILELRNHKPTDDEMLDQLRSVLRTRGRLTGALIDQFACLRKNSSYFHHFGGLRRAYERLGYTSPRDLSFLDYNAALKEMQEMLLKEVSFQLKANGAVVEMYQKTGTLKVNGDFGLRVIVTRCLKSHDGGVRWWIPKRPPSDFDLTIVARMNDDNTRILDYFLFPANEHPRKKLLVTSETSVVLNVFRFETLDHVYRICRRRRVGDSV